jgi:hypothetical protein
MKLGSTLPQCVLLAWYRSSASDRYSAAEPSAAEAVLKYWTTYTRIADVRLLLRRFSSISETSALAFKPRLCAILCNASQMVGSSRTDVRRPATTIV